MPLLKRKRVPPIETPKYDPAKKESKETLVWYSPLTQEIFTDYSYPFSLYIYLQRLSHLCEAHTHYIHMLLSLTPYSFL